MASNPYYGPEYEMMDWELEARRVARAFGVSEECYFQECLVDQPVESGLGSNFTLVWKNGDERCPLPEREGAFFECIYYKKSGSKTYFLEWLDEYEQVSIQFKQDGKVSVQRENWQLAHLLAKALFYLDLLTPAAEEALEVTVSHHEKLEWSREYEVRYDV